MPIRNKTLNQNLSIMLILYILFITTTIFSHPIPIPSITNQFFIHPNSSKLSQPANHPVTPGNLLITQPNEIMTYRFLIEVTPSGKFIQSFNLYFDKEDFYVQPIDVKIVNGNCYLLDFRRGIFIFNMTSGKVISRFGEANEDHLGISLFTFAADQFGNLFVADLDTFRDGTRIPSIHKISNKGKYMGRILTEMQMKKYALSVAIDAKDNIWISNNDATFTSLRKFLPNGTLVGEYVPRDPTIRKLASLNYHNGIVFVTSLGEEGHPDAVLLYDLNGKFIQKIPMISPTGHDTPSGTAFIGNRMYTVNSSPYTAHPVQVFDVKSGKFEFGFGEDYMAQTFNGIVVVP